MAAEKWWGKNPTPGLQESILSMIKEIGVPISADALAQEMAVPKGSVSAAASALYTEGWLTRSDGKYALADPPPVEDRARVHKPAWTINRKPRDKGPQPDFKLDEDYIVRCVAYGKDGKPILRAESGKLYKLHEI